MATAIEVPWDFHIRARYDGDLLGGWWTTNGQAALRVRDIDAGDVSDPFWDKRIRPEFVRVAESMGVAVKRSDPEPHTREPTEPADYDVAIGAGRFRLDYVEMVETLYPGCEWHTGSHHARDEPRAYPCAIATLDGEIVALVQRYSITPEMRAKWTAPLSEVAS